MAASLADRFEHHLSRSAGARQPRRFIDSGAEALR